jgi:mRNA interferase RelE/StbE
VRKYRLEVAPRVAKDLAGLSKIIRLRVAATIDKLADDPRPPGVKKLVGEEAYRIRVGDYRIIYEIADDRLLVLVVRVGHRKEIYETSPNWQPSKMV